jgi:uncharacterized protein (TIGR03032 family)
MSPRESAGDLRSVHTSNLPTLLDHAGVSLVVSTYQAGKAIVIRNDGGSLNTHFRTFSKPMGIVADGSRLTIGGTNTVWDYHNMPAVARKLEPPGKHDACFLPRRIHVTGDIDIHELARDGDGELWVVNTRFCCLCTLDPAHSFRPRWRPPFVSALAPEDRCHLNGIAMVDGRPKYVTALGTTDSPGGWRANKARGGILMDVDTNEIVLRGLSMPHSPRWYRGQLWILESGEGSLVRVDLERRSWQTVAQLPGFTRGLDFAGPLAFIGLSQVRESAVFSGIPLVERLKERTCGVWVVNIETGQTLGFLRFEAGVQEIFAVQALQGIRFPEILERNDERLAHSYVLPDDALAEVSLPTGEELARSPGFHFGRGNDLYRQGKLDGAIAAYEQCLALQPDYPDARYNCAVALGDAGHHARAIAYLEQVVRAEPERAEAHNSLGYLFSVEHRPSRAVACWERAIALRPDYAQAHRNLAVTLLSVGDYGRGFAEYEWCGPESGFDPGRRWNGDPIRGRTLLIHADQSARDAIQFARYLPLAAERCGALILACERDVMPLFDGMSAIAQLREPRQVRADEFDVHLPMRSLPHVFRTALDTVPQKIPYLNGTALRRRGGTSSLVLPSADCRVGIAWAGGAGDPDDLSSCPVRELLPILRTPDLVFYAAQMGSHQQDLAELPADVHVHDLGSHLRDLGDLGMVLEQLELIISVDGPLVHLAGALGKPVWTLLGERTDWRWMTEGETTPWYPTMRLFRQSRRGDWGPVVERVAAALGRERGKPVSS